MIAGFTGTRKGMTLAQKLYLAFEFHRLKVTELHHGSCVGADEEANTIAREMGIRTVGHPPTDTKYQATCTCDEWYPRKPYIERNHIIVDCTVHLFVAPYTNTEVMRGSGTWATFRYAMKRDARAITMVERSDMTTEEQEQNKELMLRAKIDGMTQIEMARKYRFASIGDPIFQGRVGDYFQARFNKLGGFTPAISKLIGW